MIASNQKLFLSLFYVVLVHSIDISLYYNNINYFISSTGVDFFKLLFWLVVPLIFSIKHFDKNFYSFKNIKRADILYLSLVIVVGICSMLLIPYIDVLRDYYVMESSLSSSENFSYISYQICWIFSWLIGWEFIHRYFLIKSIKESKIYLALWILPIIEGLYHLNKPWPEILAVLLFSWVLTRWTLKRSNALLPLLAHFIIEIELIIFQLYLG